MENTIIAMAILQSNVWSQDSPVPHVLIRSNSVKINRIMLMETPHSEENLTFGMNCLAFMFISFCSLSTLETVH